MNPAVRSVISNVNMNGPIKFHIDISIFASKELSHTESQK
jgi:hypothetical protein